MNDKPSRIRSSQSAGSQVFGFQIPGQHSEVKGVCPESEPEPRETRILGKCRSCDRVRRRDGKRVIDERYPGTPGSQTASSYVKTLE